MTIKISIIALIIASVSHGATVRDFLLALEQVESGGDELAYNEGENALGCLQIRPIMVSDYNRIYGTTIDHSEVKDRATSHKIAVGIFKHYSKSIEAANAKHLAFIWNGGGSAWRRVDSPRNDKKQENLNIYWNKVQRHLQ